MTKSKSLNLGAMAIVILGLASCRPSVTDAELQAISAWLTCIECTDGEREYVTDSIGAPAIGPLSEILLDFPEGLRENRRLELEAQGRVRGITGAELAQFVDLFMSNFEASVQRRAVIALDDLGATRVLDDALEDAALIARLRDDVVEMIHRVLPPVPDTTGPTATPATITVAPASLILEQGSSGLFVATVRDVDGLPLSDSVRWRSSDTTVARATSQTPQGGLVEILGVGGPVRITAFIGSLEGTAQVTSEARLPAGYSITSLSGDGSQGTVDTLLAAPLVAEVLDSMGLQKENLVVIWEVQSGEAWLVDEFGDTTRTWSDRTDTRGKSEATLWLGGDTRLVRVAAKIGRAMGRPSTRFRIRPVR